MPRTKKTLTAILAIITIGMLALSIDTNTHKTPTEQLKYTPSATVDRVKFRAFNITTKTIDFENLLTNNYPIQYQYEIDNRRYSFVSVNITYTVIDINNRTITRGKSYLNVAPFTRGTEVATISLPAWAEFTSNDVGYSIRANALIEGITTEDTYIPFKVINAEARTQLFILISAVCLITALILNGKQILTILCPLAKGNKTT